MEKASKYGLTTTPREITATDAANHFGALLDEVAGKAGHYLITRLGRPRAVMISVDEYREILDILETLEELEDKEYMAGVREAREEIALGRTMTLEELEERLGLSGLPSREEAHARAV
jgi:prevent-host-death family protein